MIRVGGLAVVCATALACAERPASPPAAIPSAARNLVIITIDTLRADRVGAFGYVAARTLAMDALAARGVRFERAYAASPITLPSHATMMTGQYPQGHGARHNGMRIDLSVPTLADTLGAAGFSTGAFVAAFPLDRRFGLIKGFRTYSDRMPRGARGRLDSERPGREVVDEAIAWLATHRGGRFFLWVHLFEPHAPYVSSGAAPRSVADRYGDEVAEADRQAGRVVEAAGDDTLIVLTADHGEAFGEHGEIGHSIFVYDTTLRVPLIVAGPSLTRRTVSDPVALVDLAPTALRALGLEPFDADGVDLGDVLRGAPVPARDVYAESFAPLLDFGWSSLQTVRSAGWKYIAAPRPELYDLQKDAGESRDLAPTEGPRAAALQERVLRFAPLQLSAKSLADPDTAARLQALGYVSGSTRTASGPRADPKDRRELAARIATWVWQVARPRRDASKKRRRRCGRPSASSRTIRSCSRISGSFSRTAAIRPLPSIPCSAR
ncbi:MAG: sulfatase [Acidobacteria bacterium]|nr:sulfatase [Acidobacteriota bacterium]